MGDISMTFMRVWRHLKAYVEYLAEQTSQYSNWARAVFMDRFWSQLTTFVAIQ